MAATDTVVGIVGAVLLAGIMVAVFVYEYNNPPSPGGPPDPTLTDEQRVAQWSQDYPGLAAKEDMDLDGTPNYNDTDMDDNGEVDVNQTGDLRIVIPVAYTNPAAARDAKAYPVTILSGAYKVDGYLNWTTPAPAPLNVPTFSCSFQKEGGTPATCQGSSAPTDTSHHRTFSIPSDVAAGAYTFTVTVAQPGPQASYTGAIVVNYGPAHPPKPAEPEPEPVK